MFSCVTAVSSMKPNIMDPTNCIVVQDAVTHDQITQDSISTQSPTEGKICFWPWSLKYMTIFLHSPKIMLNYRVEILIITTKIIFSILY